MNNWANYYMEYTTSSPVVAMTTANPHNTNPQRDGQAMLYSQMNLHIWPQCKVTSHQNHRLPLIKNIAKNNLSQTLGTKELTEECYEEKLTPHIKTVKIKTKVI